MSWSPIIKLGVPGTEVEIDTSAGVDSVDSIDGSSGNTQGEDSNLHAEVFTVVNGRFKEDWNLQISYASEALKDQLVSLSHAREQELAFMFSEGEHRYGDAYERIDATHLKLDVSCFLKLDKAYDSLSLAEVVTFQAARTVYRKDGTTGGYPSFYSSFDRQTWIMTLSSDPGTSPLYLDWTYKGALVKMVGDGVRWALTGSLHPTLGTPLYRISVRLKGV